jgi:hypothetical protein
MNMKPLIGLTVAACFCTLTFAQQPNQPAKPSPELKKLAPYLGQWRYEGKSKAGALGPTDKFTGNATGEMIRRGFFLEWRWKDQGTTTATSGFEINSYDAVNKNFASSWFVDDGSSCIGSYVVDGNKFSYSGKCVDRGKQYLSRITEVFAADMMSFVQKAEISIDGKTWRPAYEAKYTKVAPVPKKQE